MILTSYTFLFLFLPLGIVLNAIIKVEYKKYLLLLMNLIFLLYTGKSSVIVISTMLVVYGCGILISKSSAKTKKIYLITSLNAILALLVFFKFRQYLPTGLKLEHWAIPLGISFYTFQGISYLVDVYRGKVKAEHSIIMFSVYLLSFFTITSGPIYRYTDYKVAINDKKLMRSLDYTGLQRILFGLFKKIHLSNIFAAKADLVYVTFFNNGLTSGAAWLGSVSFALQLYFDFSGYSDIVIGIASLFGFKLPENFNYPYVAQSFADFWNRWHMSLTKWFKDYIYIPLGGNRKGGIRTLINMLCVWIITGLWHGSTSTFIAWGLFNFIFIVIERFVLKGKLALPKILSRVLGLFLINLGWVLFRSSDFTQAWTFIQKLIIFDNNSLGIDQLLTHTLTNSFEWILALMLCTPYPRKVFESFSKSESKIMNVIAGIILVLIALVSLSYLFSNTYQSFIYQQF